MENPAVEEDYQLLKDYIIPVIITLFNVQHTTEHYLIDPLMTQYVTPPGVVKGCDF